MFFLFKEHHILPSNFIKLGYNEKLILAAFAEKEVELNKDKLDDFSKIFLGV